MPDDDVLLVLTTVSDERSATTLAHALVAERLAACVSRMPTGLSVYRWQGRVHEDAEQQLLIKTVRGRLAALQKRLLELHPYELPELVAVEAAAGSEAWLDWVRAACLPPH